MNVAIPAAPPRRASTCSVTATASMIGSEKAPAAPRRSSLSVGSLLVQEPTPTPRRMSLIASQPVSSHTVEEQVQAVVDAKEACNLEGTPYILRSNISQHSSRQGRRSSICSLSRCEALRYAKASSGLTTIMNDSSTPQVSETDAQRRACSNINLPESPPGTPVGTSEGTSFETTDTYKQAQASFMLALAHGILDDHLNPSMNRASPAPSVSSFGRTASDSSVNSSISAASSASTIDFISEPKKAAWNPRLGRKDRRRMSVC